MKKILFFTSYLGGGGAEKHVVRLLNGLSPDLFDILVVTPDRPGSYEKELNKNIRLQKIGSRFAFKLSPTLARISCLKPLRKIIQQEQPDLVFSVTDIHNLVAIAAVSKLKKKPKLVLGIQNTISQAYRKKNHPVHRYVLSHVPKDYPKADKIVALTEGVKHDLLQLAPALVHKVDVINNIGLNNQLLEMLEEKTAIEKPADGKLIIACGRLTYQKGYPYLIKAFAMVRKTTNAYLWILGEGELREEIENMIREYNLEPYVRLLGFKTNPYAYMAAADLFVLSSLYEGFGNVIVEAMACGTPVVATDCPYGPNEIIKDSETGLLVPIKNEQKLAEAIVRVLQDHTLLTKLALNGKIRANDFHANKIAEKYKSVFLDVISYK